MPSFPASSYERNEKSGISISTANADVKVMTPSAIHLIFLFRRRQRQLTPTSKHLSADMPTLHKEPGTRSVPAFHERSMAAVGKP